MIPSRNDIGKEWFSARTLGVAAIFGLTAMIAMSAGLHVPIPGIAISIDGREIFVTLGAALTGPLGGVIVGLLGGLVNPIPDVMVLSIVQHVLYGCFVGWLYGHLYRRVPMPYLLAAWVGLLLIYYFILPIPGIVFFAWMQPGLFIKIFGEDLAIPDIIRVVLQARIQEFFFTAFVSTAVLAVLPRKYRRPLWMHPEVPEPPSITEEMESPPADVEGLRTGPPHLVLAASGFGVAGALLAWARLQMNIPWAEVLTGPREVVVSIGAALTGPWYGMLVGLLASLPEPGAHLRLYIALEHIVGCALLGWAYARYVYPLRRPALFLLGWGTLLFSYYFGVYLSGFAAMALFSPQMYQVLTSSGPPRQVFAALSMAWLPEYVLTTVLTGTALMLIPGRYRKPLWRFAPRMRSARHSRKLLSASPGYFLGVRLAIWFLVLSIIPLTAIGVFIQNDVSREVAWAVAGQQREMATMVAQELAAHPTETALDVVGFSAVSGHRHVAVLDTQGVYVAGTEGRKIGLNAHTEFSVETLRRALQEPEGALIESQTGAMVGFARVPDKPLVVVISAERQTIAGQLARLEESSYMKLTTALLIISLAAGLVIWIVISRPMRTLTRAVKDVASGRLDVTVDAGTMDDEVAVLAGAFNEMTANLQSARKGLEAEIDERTRTQEMLQDRERQFRLLAENSTDMISRHAPDGRYLYASPACEMLLGFRPEELAGRNAFDLVHPEDEPRIRHTFTLLLSDANVQPVTYRLRRKDGAYLWVESMSRPVREKLQSGVAEIQMSTRDITRRKLAENALVESEERLRTVIANVPVILFALDNRGIFTLSEGRGLSALGLTPGEVVGSSVFDVYRNVPEILENVRKAFDGQTVFSSVNVGGLVYDTWYSPLRDSNGNVVGIIGVASDVTERRWMEEIIRRSEQMYKALVEQSSDPIYVLQSRRLVFVNRAWEKLFGFSAREVLDPEFVLDSIVSPESRQTVEQRLTLYDKDEMPPLRYELKARNKAGETLDLDVSVTRIEWNGAPAIQGIYRDITARKKADAEMLQRQKMESLGVLAGGVAHDFNNLLQAILGHISLSIKKIPPGNPALDNIGKAERAAERAADLTRQLLAYSGKGKFDIRPLSLNDMIRENLHLLEVGVHKSVRLQQELAPDLPLIEADPGQVQQVIMNLIINASEAIGERGGRILLRTAVIELQPHDAGRWSQPEMTPSPGRYALLEVSDDGSGINTETLKMIFDPFFTTKFTGRGLGLSAILGIMKGHHGGIQVRSEPGAGSTFSVIFPAIDAPPVLSVHEQAGRRQVDLGGTVLVVDDEPGVRDVVVEILNEAGMRSLAARDGEEALRLFEKHGKEIGLVLLDLSMPGIGGKETFRRLMRIDPGIPVILSSGFNESEATEDLASLPPAGFIQKPYRWDTLLDTLVQVIRSSRRAGSS